MNTDAMLSLAERFSLRPPLERWEAAVTLQEVLHELAEMNKARALSGGHPPQPE